MFQCGNVVFKFYRVVAAYIVDPPWGMASPRIWIVAAPVWILLSRLIKYPNDSFYDIVNVSKISSVVSIIKQFDRFIIDDSFGKFLQSRGVEILSTGGTAAALTSAGVAVREVSEHTGYPEIMDGRVKTLHPTIAGGVLAVRENPGHVKAMEDHAIAPIDLVVMAG